MLAFQEIIVTGDGLGTNPRSLSALVEVLEDPASGADLLLPIVELDMGLTAELLRFCNSSFYGRRHEIGTVREALVLTGNLAFSRIALMASMKQMLQRDLPAYQLTMDQVWRQGLMTAIGAAHIVEVLGHPEQRDRAFTAGLLHDCGKLLLDQELAGSTPRVQNVDGQIPIEVERAVTGFDHAEAGAVIMDHWGFPPLLVHAVLCHHKPRQAGMHGDVATAVFIADQLGHLRNMGVAFDAEVVDSPYDELVALGVEVGDLVALYDMLPDGDDDLTALALDVRSAPGR